MLVKNWRYQSKSFPTQKIWELKQASWFLPNIAVLESRNCFLLKFKVRLSVQLSKIWSSVVLKHEVFIQSY